MHRLPAAAVIACCAALAHRVLADESPCERRCTGEAALRAGQAECLPADIISREFTAEVTETWAPDWVPERKRDCLYGTYFADGGACALRLFSKADILNCHKEEMDTTGKRTRLIFIGGSNQYNMVKAMLDILDQGRGTRTFTRGSSVGPYNAARDAQTWQRGGASSTLDAIYDGDMNLRYIREGGAVRRGETRDPGFSRRRATGLRMPRARDVREIQDAPDFGAGSFRITWFAARFGVDVDNAVRLSMGLRAVRSRRFNTYDFSHPGTELNSELNSYSNYTPPRGTAHYNWTSEEQAIIDVHVEQSSLHSPFLRYNEEVKAGDALVLEQTYMRQWLVDLMAADVRAQLPLRSVIWADTFGSPGPVRSPTSHYMEAAIRQIQEGRTSNTQPYIDFQYQHNVGIAFLKQYGFKLHRFHHSLKPWSIWYLTQFLSAVCSIEGDHVSMCASWGRFRNECFETGANWLVNQRAICQYDSGALLSSIGPGYCDRNFAASDCPNGTELAGPIPCWRAPTCTDWCVQNNYGEDSCDCGVCGSYGGCSETSCPANLSPGTTRQSGSHTLVGCPHDLDHEQCSDQCCHWQCCSAPSAVEPESVWTPRWSMNQAASRCSAGSYIRSGTCHRCPAGQHQPESGHSATCIDCAPGKYTADVGGTSCSDCIVGRYQNNPGQSSCEQATICSTEDEFESGPLTRTTDRVCTVATVCTDGVEYETRALSTVEDRHCGSITNCTDAEFELSAFDRTHDRVCNGLTNCTTEQFEATPAGRRHDRRCDTISACTSIEYETSSPTATSNRVCTLLSVCSAAQYESAPPAADRDRICLEATICDSYEIEVSQLSPTSDRTCQCDTGTQVWASQDRLQCLPCEASHYDHDMNATTACIPCPSGQYSLVGADMCTAHPTVVVEGQMQIHGGVSRLQFVAATQELAGSATEVLVTKYEQTIDTTITIRADTKYDDETVEGRANLAVFQQLLATTVQVDVRSISLHVQQRRRLQSDRQPRSTILGGHIASSTDVSETFDRTASAFASLLAARLSWSTENISVDRLIIKTTIEHMQTFSVPRAEANPNFEGTGIADRVAEKLNNPSTVVEALERVVGPNASFDGTTCSAVLLYALESPLTNHEQMTMMNEAVGSVLAMAGSALALLIAAACLCILHRKIRRKRQLKRTAMGVGASFGDDLKSSYSEDNPLPSSIMRPTGQRLESAKP